MNKYYVIVPACLLVGFIFVYRGAVSNIEAREKHLKEMADQKAADDAKQHQEIERKAAEDAAKQSAKRAEEDRLKQEKKDNDYKNAMNQLKTEADTYSSEADKLAKESAELELTLTQTRTLKDKTNTEVFDLTKQVELAKINRRNAELEIQRLIEMVGAKASASALTAMPPAAPPAPK